MRRRHLELLVGSGLLLGPLVYALTLEPEVVVETVAIPAPSVPAAEPVIPIACEPTPAPVLEPAVASAPVVEPDVRMPFAFVTSAGIVLDGAADPAWGTGRVRAHHGPGQFRAAKSVDEAKLPTDLYAQRGRTFDLYGAKGRVCTARIGELAVLAQHDGPSLWDVFADSEEMIEGWADYEAFEANPPSSAKTRARLWTLTADERPWLVGEVVSDESCEGALWARDAELPPPAVLVASDDSSPVTQERIHALVSSPAYAELRANYRKWYRTQLDDEGRTDYSSWSQIQKAHPPVARAWLDAHGDTRWVEIRFGEASGGCGEGFDATLTAMDTKVDGTFESTDRALDPIAVFDADLDGRDELLYEDEEGSGYWMSSETEALTRSLSIPQAFVCPC